ncbi:hypothetical protein Misp01_37060 [Microtetraspora sp. NBRC 13810]|uniref:ComEA family DNA-binding protein n=1 Tax=Microtetraspora sp. NBRC 13810 TaxID=3030990 RepID=UPI00249FA765|nr:ComEA family DNA-binding protein [Microtetraspora sp. NBRC 13810]GLW08576.1 hypothetical protein Misp01_37060 [Microtetraspora sp. NBRC 13810]
MRTDQRADERATAEARLRALRGHPSPARPFEEDDRPGGRALAPPGSRPSLAGLRRLVADADPGGPRLKVLVAIGVLAAAVGGLYAWRAQPVAEPLPPPPAAPPVVARPSASPSPEVTVHVAGKVRRPGVVTLPGGARVKDAIAAAGGAKKAAATGTLNLARRLIDGEQIVVGAPGGGSPPPLADPMTGAVVDLNTATVEQLDLLPGVGEVLARRILDYREANGGFRSVEQLNDVSGIGDSKYADIKDKVRV